MDETLSHNDIAGTYVTILEYIGVVEYAPIVSEYIIDITLLKNRYCVRWNDGSISFTFPAEAFPDRWTIIGKPNNEQERLGYKLKYGI